MMSRLALALCALIVAAACPSRTFASESLASGSDARGVQAEVEEMTVTVTGVGTDIAAAKSDAIREAVRQAVGVFVDVKTVVNGSRLVEDRILSATSAFVVGSKAIEGPTRRGDGTYEVKSEVKIRKKNLLGSLTDAGFKVTGAIDGESARKVSEVNLKNAEEARAVLKDRLSSLWSKLMVARLLDEKGKPLGEGDLPKVVQLADGTSMICANVQVYFHLEAYYTKFVPEMTAILEALCEKKVSSTVNRHAWIGKGPRPRTRFGEVPIHLYAPDPNRGEALDREGNRATVWLSVGRDRTAQNEQFTGFVLSSELGEEFVRACRSIDRGRFRIELLDEPGGVVSSEIVGARLRTFGALSGRTASDQTKDFLTVPVESVVVGEPVRSWLGHCLNENPPNPVVVLISPVFRSFDFGYFRDLTNNPDWKIRGEGAGGSDVCDVLESRLELVLPSADLENVKGYRITAIESDEE